MFKTVKSVRSNNLRDKKIRKFKFVTIGLNTFKDSLDKYNF